MSEHILLGFTAILVLGVGAQWLAWRVRLPSILLLLLFGLAIGPLTGWLDPDELFGKLLLPGVSLAVAWILYDGGLSLKLAELRKVGGDLLRLLTLGTAVTWGVAFLAARWILHVEVTTAALLAAVLVVTGPTVIGPLLRLIRPSGPVGPLLKWEAIVIDPLGAVLAVLLFEIVQAPEAPPAAYAAAGILRTVLVGGGLGWIAAAILARLLARHAVPDHLENAVSLMLVTAVFTLANHLQSESGLLAATVMGFALANQRRADVTHITEFKENLQVLLIASLFIVLAARVDVSSLKAVGLRGVLFASVLILVARPLAVLVSTIRSPLSRAERMFLAWVAPRGIVAAAVASVFALRLKERGVEAADRLVPVTLIVILLTVTVYGLTAPWVARRLGVAEAFPQGILFAGAASWVRKLALLLQREGIRVMLVDTNRAHIREARMAGLPTYAGSVLGEFTLDRIDFGGLGRLLAVTPNDWVNILAVRRFERIFGRKECYQLPPHPETDKPGARYAHLHGRLAFGERCHAALLERRLREGFVFKATPLTETFDFETFRARYGPDTIVLFRRDGDGRLHVVTADEELRPQPGETLISLLREPEASNDSAP